MFQSVKRCCAVRPREQPFRQHDTRALSAELLMGTLPDAIKAVARCNDPCIGCRAPFLLAEVLENCRVFRRYIGKVIKSFVYAGSERCRCDIMPEDTLIHNLGKECSLGNQFVQQSRNI